MTAEEPVLVPVDAETLADLVRRPAATGPTTGPAPESLAAAVDTAALDDLRRQAVEPDAVRALLAERVGVARDADLATITAALDRALAERPFAGPPAGSELVDTPTLNQLKEEAEAGRTSRVREVLNSALREGRMRPADRPRWERLLNLDFDSTAAMIKSLPVVVPVSPIGYSGDDEDRDPLYDDMFGGT